MATFEGGLQSCVRKQGCHNRRSGDALNVSRWAVHNYEAGKNRPDFDGLIALADYFDVSWIIWSDAPTAGNATRRAAFMAARSQEQARPCWMQSVKHSNRYL